MLGPKMEDSIAKMLWAAAINAAHQARKDLDKPIEQIADETTASWQLVLALNKVEPDGA